MGIARNVINKITNWFRGSPTKGMTEEDFAEWLGISYKNKSELREATYYTCMKILSETMGKLPIKVYEWQKSKGRVRADPDSTSKLLNQIRIQRRQYFLQRWKTTETITEMDMYGYKEGYLGTEAKILDFGSCNPIM